ncbi:MULTISPECIES: transglycosylase SLT domain-containing protein [Paraburkholderia]|uniref:transglycosylase SLT domain-containing protein n=1 Tax=Paraburkholderia TaxID=1822464 RepID=UPI00224FCDF8|nr:MULTISPECIES: transglycosylase SLT domain-containing protein [Paraburkholderia]MCX4155000.1 transglycosylase SLT domain-containing protein [Paraburkholderia aspalathi]MDN7164410.1 lytic transglycosylase domain-containing protein [Paraburkholderia sp. SECH2]MDQ6392895.1 lytic transglycosylase domain-containing protein [Paraburkholderia aspalathi]
MPTIPIYEQQAGVGGGYQAPEAQGGQFSTSVAQAAGELTGGLRELTEADLMTQKTNERVLGEQQEQTARTWAGNAASQATLDWTQQLDAKKQAASGAAVGFTPAVLGDFDAYASKTLENAPTPLARNFLQQHLTNLRTNIGQQAISFEANAAIGDRITTTQNSIDNWANVVAKDPSQYTTALATINATMPDVGPEKKQLLAQKAQQAIGNAAVQNLIATDPVAANNLIQTRLYGKPLGGPTSGNGPAASPDFEGAMETAVLPDNLKGVARSIYQQETSSGTNPAMNTPNSSGVTGPMQVAQTTFNSLQKQGLIPAAAQWTNPADNTNAGLVLIKKLGGEYNGDASKIAAAYYSGEKAVNPDGSINNFHDPLHPNAPDTNGYVSQVTGRLNASNSAVNLTQPSIQPVGDEPAAKSGNPALDAMNIHELLGYSHQAVEASGKVQAQTRIAVEQQAKDQSAAALNGQPPQNPLQMHDFVAAYGTAGAARYQDYANTMTLGANIARVGTLPADQQQAVLASMTPKVSATDAGYADAQKNYTLMSNAIDYANKQRANDPVGYAAWKGLGQVNPINWSDPAKAQAELANRQSIGTMMSTKFGTPTAILTNQEAQDLSQQIDQSPVSQKIGIIKSIRAGVTDPIAYRQAIAQIAPNAPMVAFAGNAAAAQPVMINGQPQTGTQIGAQILEGEDMLRVTKKGGDSAGTQSPSKIDETTFKTVYQSQTAGAFQNLNGPYGAKANDEVYQAARDYLMADAQHQGMTFEKASEDSGMVKKAITAVTGGGVVPVGSWGNKSNLLVPWGMDQQAFSDQFPARAQATLDAAGLKKEEGFDASRYQYDNIGDGKYAFRVGGKYALDPKSGQPLMIDFSKPLTPNPVPVQASPANSDQVFSGAVTPQGT